MAGLVRVRARARVVVRARVRVRVRAEERQAVGCGGRQRRAGRLCRQAAAENG